MTGATSTAISCLVIPGRARSATAAWLTFANTWLQPAASSLRRTDAALQIEC